MQRGFLGQTSTRVPVAEANDAAKPTNATDHQLQECLELLRGPGDERKYVSQIADHIHITFGLYSFYIVFPLLCIVFVNCMISIV